MNTYLSTSHTGVLHPQFTKDAAGNRLVVLPQAEFELLLSSKAANANARLALAEMLKKESEAVQASSTEVLREFEAIEL
jgi:hypothetical protein